MRCLIGTTSGINPPFGGLSRSSGQVAYVLLDRSPLGFFLLLEMTSLDLHFLGTPQAFVLSQDQTLHRKSQGGSPAITATTNAHRFISRCLQGLSDSKVCTLPKALTLFGSQRALRAPFSGAKYTIPPPSAVVNTFFAGTQTFSRAARRFPDIALLPHHYILPNPRKRL